MICTLTLNPALDKSYQVSSVTPGTLHRLQAIRHDAGGKGINVAKILKNFPCESLSLGFKGGQTGEQFMALLEELNLPHDFTPIDEATRVNVKILDDHQALTEFNEAGPVVSMEEQQALQGTIESYLTSSNVFVLSGSLPQGVAPDYYANLCRRMQAAGTKVLIDADGAVLKEAVEAGPFCIKPNNHELAGYFNVASPLSLTQIASYCLYWHQQKGIKFIVVSLGAEGAVFSSERESFYALPLKVSVASAVGAGDSMVGALAYAIEQNLPMEETIRWAMAASAAAVSAPGSSQPDKELMSCWYPQVVIKKIR